MSKLLDALDSKVKFSLTLPETLYNHYASQGEASGRSPEDEIVERLRRCKEYTAAKPLYFNDDERAQLEQAIGHTARSAGHVVNGLRTLTTITVAGVDIELPSQLQQRIHSRTFRGETFQQVIEREVLRGLHQFCGLG